MTNEERQILYWAGMLDEAFLTEGDHWPEDFVRRAYNQIKKSTLGMTSWYRDEYIRKDLETMSSEYEQAELTHYSKRANLFKTVIKWFIEYAGNSFERYLDFIENKFDRIVLNLKNLFRDPGLVEKYYPDIRNRMTLAQFEEFCGTFDREKEKRQRLKMKSF